MMMKNIINTMKIMMNDFNAVNGNKTIYSEK